MTLVWSNTVENKFERGDTADFSESWFCYRPSRDLKPVRNPLSPSLLLLDRNNQHFTSLLVVIKTENAGSRGSGTCFPPKPSLNLLHFSTTVYSSSNPVEHSSLFL